jgi:hypothetical protein
MPTSEAHRRRNSFPRCLSNRTLPPCCDSRDPMFSAQGDGPPRPGPFLSRTYTSHSSAQVHDRLVRSPLACHRMRHVRPQAPSSAPLPSIDVDDIPRSMRETPPYAEINRLPSRYLFYRGSNKDQLLLLASEGSNGNPTHSSDIGNLIRQ